MKSYIFLTATVCESQSQEQSLRGRHKGTTTVQQIAHASASNEDTATMCENKNVEGQDDEEVLYQLLELLQNIFIKSYPFTISRH